MSTSGFVGIGTPTQWTARYNHTDSYLIGPYSRPSPNPP